MEKQTSLISKIWQNKNFNLQIELLKIVHFIKTEIDF